MTKAEKQRRDIEAYELWLNTLPDEFLECRDVRHQWSSQNTWGLSYGFRGRLLVCRRCGCRQPQIVDDQ